MLSRPKLLFSLCCCCSKRKTLFTKRGHKLLFYYSKCERCVCVFATQFLSSAFPFARCDLSFFFFIFVNSIFVYARESHWLAATFSRNGRTNFNVFCRRRARAHRADGSRSGTRSGENERLGDGRAANERRKAKEREEKWHAMHLGPAECVRVCVTVTLDFAFN